MHHRDARWLSTESRAKRSSPVIQAARIASKIRFNLFIPKPAFSISTLISRLQLTRKPSVSCSNESRHLPLICRLPARRLRPCCAGFSPGHRRHRLAPAPLSPISLAGRKEHHSGSVYREIRSRWWRRHTPSCCSNRRQTWQMSVVIRGNSRRLSRSLRSPMGITKLRAP